MVLTTNLLQSTTSKTSKRRHKTPKKEVTTHDKAVGDSGFNGSSYEVNLRPFYTSKSYPDPCALKGVNEV